MTRIALQNLHPTRFKFSMSQESLIDLSASTAETTGIQGGSYLVPVTPPFQPLILDIARRSALWVADLF